MLEPNGATGFNLPFFQFFCKLSDCQVKIIDILPDIFRKVIQRAKVFLLLELQQIHASPEFLQFG